MKIKTILVLVFIFGAAATYLFFIKSNTLPISLSTPMQLKPKNLVETKLVVAGDFVTISVVTLLKPGFVMIHESDRGNTSRIVMTGDYLIKGVHENIVVHTGITTKPGEKYFAMLHFDNGNAKYDDPGTDTPVISDGRIVQ